MTRLPAGLRPADRADGAPSALQRPLVAAAADLREADKSHGLSLRRKPRQRALRADREGRPRGRGRRRLGRERDPRGRGPGGPRPLGHQRQLCLGTACRRHRDLYGRHNRELATPGVHRAGDGRKRDACVPSHGHRRGRRCRHLQRQRPGGGGAEGGERGVRGDTEAGVRRPDGLRAERVHRGCAPLRPGGHRGHHGRHAVGGVHRRDGDKDRAVPARNATRGNWSSAIAWCPRTGTATASIWWRTAWP